MRVSQVCPEEVPVGVTVDWSDQRGWLVLNGLFEAPIPFALEVHYRGPEGDERVFRPTRARAVETGWRFEGEHLALDLAAVPVSGGVRLDWSLEARAVVHLEQVLPARFGPDWPHLEAPERVRAFQNGFQSWTPSYGVRGDHREVRPLIHLFSLMSHYVDSPWWVRGDGFTSNGFLVLQGEEEEVATLLGFLSYRVGHGELFFRNQGRRELIASADYGGRRCEVGERLAGEALWIARGAADGLVDRWAEMTATEMGMEGGRRPDGAVDAARSPLGWCSWYEYYTGVREADMLANLAVVGDNPQLGVAVMQLDDGYQTAVGDWLSINDKFPRGLGPLADDIHARGFSAGIWTAPFFVSARSQVFREHPDWFVRDRKGRPFFSSYNPMWNTRLYSVDLTHPEVEGWLAETYGALVEAGYDYHKIDFLYAGIRRGTRYDPGRSPVEAYRNGLRVIREALGPDRFLLGCGAPLGPSLGYVDAMRISQDVKESWDDWYARWFGRGGGYPTARGALRNVMTRSFLHRRWWLNDPDCLLVRDRNTKLDLHETRLLVTVLGMSGGMLFLSDDLAALAPDRLHMAEAVLPAGPLDGRPTDLLEAGAPRTYRLVGEQRRLEALVNWETTAVRREVPRGDDVETGWGFWAERVVDSPEVEVPRHGVRALLFTPMRPVPHLVGTTLHLVALVDGRIAEDFDEAAGLLVVRGPRLARKEGSVWVRVPEGWKLEATQLDETVSVADRWSGGVVLSVALRPGDDGGWQVEVPFARGDGGGDS
jgi:alpha-galactosidase